MFSLFSVGLSKIRMIAGNPNKRAVNLSPLNCSPKNSQAPKMEIISDNLWATSVFTIPMCFTEVARKRNTTGIKIPNGIRISHGEVASKTVKSGLKNK
ncbi:hypothetical protein D3C87_1885940 [compost metagenome]